MHWLRRLWNTLRPGRVTRDIEREIAFHLAERIDDLRSQGLSEREAERRARRMFGNVTLQAERTRDADTAAWADALLRNLRYAVRTLRRAPGFAVAAILTLALGIGANTAVFSAIDAVLLAPLPFPDGERLVGLSQTQAASGETAIAPVRLEEWDRLNTTFDAITGYYVEDASETSGDLPERLRRAFVAPRFLEVWRVAPALGRAFTAEEHRAGGPAAVLVSERYWERRFGANPDVIGRSVRIGRASAPIVGVMPASFLFPDLEVDLWFPVQTDIPPARRREATWFTGVGRLQAGVSLAEARANLAAVQAQLADQHPGTDRDIGVALEPLKTRVAGDIGASLWLVFAAVTVLLLITCTNVAALLLARATRRRHEISVRISLGAGRTAVVAQVLTETLVLALAGGGAGLVVASLAVSALRSAGADLPRMQEIGIDGRILAYTLLISATVALVCGLLPALRASRSDPAGVSRDAGRSQVSSRHTLPWLLVGVQVALSVTLLAGAGLLVRSLQELWRLDPGFDTSRVLTFRISGGWGETADYDRLLQRIDTTLERLRTLPGVEHAATAGFAPGVPARFDATFEVVESRRADGAGVVAESRAVAPAYFATLGIPLLDGELCRAQPWTATMELMVNRAFVERHLGDRPSATGLHLSMPGDARPPGRIVGIVGDARERGLATAPGPVVYTCFVAPTPTPVFLLRTAGGDVTLPAAVRRTVKELDPARAVYELLWLDERIGGAFAETRLRTLVLAVFALAALSLACVGLYATLSYVVGLRRREIGLRLALGAMRSDILRQFLLRALGVAAAACVFGLVLAFVATRSLAGMLVGVSPLDPPTFAGVVLLVLLVASLAALTPAVRAARTPPMRVLRED